MQKTVVFGKAQEQENISPKREMKPKCRNCLQLQAQLAELTLLSGQSQRSVQCESESQNEAVKLVQAELLELKGKYLTLKKKVEQIESENDDLFQENSRLAKQLTACKIHINKLEEERREPLLLESEGEYEDSQAGNCKGCDEHSKIVIQLRSQHEKMIKQMQVGLFVWKEKTDNLQKLMKDQNDQIARLKELLKRRNKLQEDRHRLLQTVCC